MNQETLFAREDGGTLEAHPSKTQEGSSAELHQKLMVGAFVCPESSCAFSAEVRRGMLILSSEGQEVGKVAAVVLNEERHQATHILLGRLPEVSGYWLVPVDRIRAVRDGHLELSIPEAAVDSLPRWNSH